jgi:hypothetical protein
MKLSRVNAHSFGAPKDPTIMTIFVIGTEVEKELARVKRELAQVKIERDTKKKIFYNRQRTQARLGYLSPAAYERQFHQMPIAA